MRSTPTTILALSLTFALASTAQDKEHRDLKSDFAEFAEPGFPFITHTLDARHLGDDWPKDNLTQRGVIVRIGGGYYGCFDTDLLRWALVWKENKDGEWLTMQGMSTGSYRLPDRKASTGQDALPRPIGTPIFASEKKPGFLIDGQPWEDTRTPSIDEGETGLGPIPAEYGRFSGIQIESNGAALQYAIGNTEVIERLSFENGKITRHIEMIEGDKSSIKFAPLVGEAPKIKFSSESNQTKSVPRWSKSLTSTITSGTSDFDLVADEIKIPVPNPWKRNVRFSGFDFFSDGTAAFCTFDGDVWHAEGLESDEVTWKRIGSGLHEPLGLEIVKDEIYVFDRNGIQLLKDNDGDSRIDYIENFCNVIPQTAETREFAQDIVAKPGGGFYIAKGGQVADTRGILNGTICEIALDGRSYKIVATGLRQPYIGIDPETGTLTASDQQGNWKPATPLRTIRPDEYYGFQPAKFKEAAQHPKTITPPELWIPHFANQSGASQVWTRNAALGPLNDSLVHIGYNRPELFRAFLDPRDGARQGAIVSLMSGLDQGLLKGRINPNDGLLYVTGFKIWGSVGQKISGIYRIRHQPDKPHATPIDVRSGERGVLIRFAEPLDETLATNLTSYTVDRWNYLRSHNYGSGNYTLDGEPGQETIGIASVSLSEDRTAIFVGLPDMQKAHSLRVTYRLPLASTKDIVPPVIQTVYLTIHKLLPIDLSQEGFATDQVDLTLKQPAGGASATTIEPTAELGKAISTQYGCIACHSTDGKAPAGAVAQQVGPTWKGLWGSKRIFTDGTILKKVDATYLRESIVDPARMVAEGYDTTKTGVGMPSYLGVLKDHEIDSIILFIKTLKK